jgi:hypothetical protein
MEIKITTKYSPGDTVRLGPHLGKSGQGVVKKVWFEVTADEQITDKNIRYLVDVEGVGGKWFDDWEVKAT